MACGCIKKGKYDIELSQRGCMVMVYEDLSIWMSGEQYEIPKTYKVKITNGSREVVVELRTDVKNLLTSVDLFSSKETQCLPDAVYCFEIDTCGVSQKITRAFLCNIECKVDELTARMRTESETTLVLKLKSKLEQVRVNVKKNKIQTAKEILKSLNEEVRELQCGSCD